MRGGPEETPRATPMHKYNAWERNESSVRRPIGNGEFGEDEKMFDREFYEQDEGNIISSELIDVNIIYRWGT